MQRSFTMPPTYSLWKRTPDGERRWIMYGGEFLIRECERRNAGALPEEWWAVFELTSDVPNGPTVTGPRMDGRG